MQRVLKMNKPNPQADHNYNESGSCGPFYDIQQPLICMIEDYLVDNAVNGKKMLSREFCERADIPVARITAIMHGHHWAAKCGRELLGKLAGILKVPVMQIYVMSGFLAAEDMVYSENLDDTLDKIYSLMRTDTRVSFRAPAKSVWESWPQSAKLSVCMLYEQVLGSVLLRYPVVSA